MMKYRVGYDLDYIRLNELLDDAGKKEEPDDFKKLVSRVEGSDIVITAWDFDYMVGFAQLCRENGEGRIKNVLVDSEYRGQGIGKSLVEYILLQGNQSCCHSDNEDEYLAYFSL